MDWPALLEAVKPYVPPFFFGTLVAGAFGAFAGAFAASRSQTKRAVVAELNSVGAALVLCFSICNRFMSLKKQHVRATRNRYVQGRQDHDAFLVAARTHVGPPPLVFDFLADFQTLSPVKVPTEILERHVFEKISISGRALAAAVDLVGAIDGLDTSIKTRNELIAEIQNASPVPTKLLLEKYFGLRNADGITDERFANNVEAIYLQTDDCIFFAKILADDLYKYGKKLRRRYAWQFRLGTPRLGLADWSAAEREGLMPPIEQYESWLKGFKDRPTKLRRFVAWLRSFKAPSF